MRHNNQPSAFAIKDCLKNPKTVEMLTVVSTVGRVIGIAPTTRSTHATENKRVSDPATDW
jgi:hypothetical protein